MKTLDLIIDSLEAVCVRFFWEGVMKQQESNWERYFSSIEKTMYSTSVVLAEN